MGQTCSESRSMLMGASKISRYSSRVGASCGWMQVVEVGRVSHHLTHDPPTRCSQAGAAPSSMGQTQGRGWSSPPTSAGTSERMSSGAGRSS